MSCSLDVARAKAEELVEKLAPHCECYGQAGIQIAGSIRRG